MSIKSRLAKIESIIKPTLREEKINIDVDLSLLTRDEIRIIANEIDEVNKTYTARAKEIFEKKGSWEVESKWVLKQG